MRIKVETLTSHFRCTLILRQNLFKAAGITCSFILDTSFVTSGLFQQARGGTSCLGNNVIGIGLTFVFLPLKILAGLDCIIKGSLHLLRRLRILHGHTDDVDTCLVAIEYALHQITRKHGNFLTAFIQHEVHLGFTYNLTNGGLCHTADITFSVAIVKQRLFNILQVVLDGKLQIDDIFIVGKHQ